MLRLRQGSGFSVLRLFTGQMRGVFLVLDTNKIQQIGVELDDLV
jgi:hypothetical protein